MSIPFQVLRLSSRLKNLCVIALVCSAWSFDVQAKMPALFRDKICLPFGSKDLSAIGAEDMNLSMTTKTRFRFGVADIPAGCEVGFQTTEERASSYTDEYMESIRSISFIRCPNGFTLAGKRVKFANFDMKGCLEEPLFLV